MDIDIKIYTPIKDIIDNNFTKVDLNNTKCIHIKEISQSNSERLFNYISPGSQDHFYDIIACSTTKCNMHKCTINSGWLKDEKYKIKIKLKFLTEIVKYDSDGTNFTIFSHAEYLKGILYYTTGCGNKTFTPPLHSYVNRRGDERSIAAPCIHFLCIFFAF